ncbi:MFS transporter [Streptomyces sp. NPDC020192]|uniref:MFS transporter n=1 Tax=Streptomyces sp. NPDC020192 TaxID=3365066 RepID=UPI0037A0D64B
METTDLPTVLLCREVRDRRGRVYRIGESDVELLGRGRIWMAFLPWAGIAAISCAAYAYLVARTGLREAHGWGGHLWPAGLWALSQAAVAHPAGRLRECGRLSARAAMTSGAFGTLLGYLALAAAPQLTAARLGFGVLAGAGAGLVHATCLTLPGKCWPERRGAATGFVASGLAVGAVPFLIPAVREAAPRTLLAAAGAGACLAAWTAGRRFRDPPGNWWPPGPDPRSVPADGVARRARERNPPAVRHHSHQQAAGAPVLWLMGLCLLGAAGVTVLGFCQQARYGQELGVSAGSVRSVTVTGGAVVAVTGAWSDRAGRRTALVAACLVLGVAQLGTGLAGRTDSAALLLCCAALTAAAGGTTLASVTAPAADHFGENHSASIHGLLAGAWLLPVAVGCGTAAMATATQHPCVTCLSAGGTGLGCAAVALFLRAPGRLSARRIVPNPHPLGEEMARHDG